VPSPLFNFLFLVALFVPAVMYICGVVMLMLSLEWVMTSFSVVCAGVA